MDEFREYANKVWIDDEGRFCFRFFWDYQIVVTIMESREYLLKEYYEPLIHEIKEYLSERGLEVESIEKQDVVHWLSRKMMDLDVCEQVLKIKTKRIESKELSTAPQGHAV